MALGRTLCIIVFPMVVSLASIVFALIAFFGSYQNAMGLQKVYFMSVDFSNISSGSISGISGLSSDVQEAISSASSAIFNELGISTVYTAGINGYCQGGSTSNISKCTTPYEPYWFDLVSILETDSNTGVNITLPSNIQDYENVLHGALVGSWVSYIIGMAFVFLTIIVGFCSFHSRFGSCCAAIIGILGALFMILASGLATGAYVTYHKYFNDNFEDFGVSANLGTTAFAVSWIAAGLAVIAALFWIFSICCGSTRRSRDIAEEKQPFMAYTPQHGYR